LVLNYNKITLLICPI